MKLQALILIFGVFLVPAGGIASERVCDRNAEGKQLLWGDLHVHTGVSLDAYAFGVRHTPADAFAFGRGQSLLHTDGEFLQLERPLDFMAVTDHAESFAITYLCGDPGSSDTEYCQSLREQSKPATGLNVFRKYLIPLLVVDDPKLPASLCDASNPSCREAETWQWKRAVRQANEANQPCHFTAFVGQEWSGTPGGAHTHRNLIYRNDRVPDETFDYLRYPTPNVLWEALDKACINEEGCAVLAIPHNSNLSEGLGFNIETETSRDLERRARYERVAEIFQSKGQSECLPNNWTDENDYCNYELSLPASTQKALTQSPDAARAAWDQLRRSYLQSVLNRGLNLAAKDGVGFNPLQLGFVGSTDTHSASAGDVSESAWRGDVWSQGEGWKGRFRRMSFNPGGLVGVWARENTRESIFDAIETREVYATSGPRIGVRVFADTSSQSRCSSVRRFEKVEGTPMGGTMASDADALFVTVMAQADQVPIERIEIVSATAEAGVVRERVDTISHDAEGKTSWCVEWEDPNFNSNLASYRYVRVFERPTPRWSQLDCQRAGVCAEYPEADTLVQERAWSSPIWFYPATNNN